MTIQAHHLKVNQENLTSVGIRSHASDLEKHSDSLSPLVHGILLRLIL